jgi:hypothetical protein
MPETPPAKQPTDAQAIRLREAGIYPGATPELKLSQLRVAQSLLLYWLDKYRAARLDQSKWRLALLWNKKLFDALHVPGYYRTRMSPPTAALTPRNEPPHTTSLPATGAAVILLTAATLTAGMAEACPPLALLTAGLLIAAGIAANASTTYTGPAPTTRPGQTYPIIIELIPGISTYIPDDAARRAIGAQLAAAQGELMTREDIAKNAAWTARREAGYAQINITAILDEIDRQERIKGASILDTILRRIARLKIRAPTIPKPKPKPRTKPAQKPAQAAAK